VDLEPLLRAIADRSTAGATVRDWSIFAQQGRRLALGIKDGEVGNPHAPLRLSESCGAHYRFVWSDGLVSRGHLERRQIEFDCDTALDSARAAAYEDPDAAWVLGPSCMPEVEIHDPETATIAGGETQLIARRLERVRQRVDDHACSTWSGSFSAGEGAVRIVTSAGLDATSKGTSTAWHVTINGEIGDGFAARRPEAFEAFERRLDRLLRMVQRLSRDAEPLAGGVRPVILDPGVVEEYVLSTLLHNLGGSAVANAEGHFRKEQFGSQQAVLREDLTLRLDPREPFKRGSYRFTGEGLPAAETRFIERGRLVQPLLDLKYARRLGRTPTPLPLAADTLYLEGPAPIPLSEALALAGGGALILSVLGVHTQDSSSGDFSLAAPQALRVDPGQPDGFAGKLRVTISGNLFEALCAEALQLVQFEDEHTPGLLFPCRIDPSRGP
jgi:PmbA protein